MSPKRPTIEEQLNGLSRLRKSDDRAAAAAQIAECLASRNNLVVSRAARMAAELGFAELEEDLIAAFPRFIDASKDERCFAKTDIVRALVDLDLPASDVFLSGLHIVQLEASFGKPVDSAIELRAACAIGLANSGFPGLILELLPRLLDEESPVKEAAARAVGASGDPAAEAVLRFKVLSGDPDSDVLLECFAALLQMAPKRSLDFLQRILDERGVGVEAAIFALGDSRLEEALPILELEWERNLNAEARRALLYSFVASRRERGLAFVFGVIREGSLRDATSAAKALAVLRDDSELCERFEAATEGLEHCQELRRAFRAA